MADVQGTSAGLSRLDQLNEWRKRKYGEDALKQKENRRNILCTPSRRKRGVSFQKSKLGSVTPKPQSRTRASFSVNAPATSTKRGMFTSVADMKQATPRLQRKRDLEMWRKRKYNEVKPSKRKSVMVQRAVTPKSKPTRNRQVPMSAPSRRYPKRNKGVRITVHKKPAAIDWLTASTKHPELLSLIRSVSDFMINKLILNEAIEAWKIDDFWEADKQFELMLLNEDLGYSAQTYAYYWIIRANHAERCGFYTKVIDIYDRATMFQPQPVTLLHLGVRHFLCKMHNSISDSKQPERVVDVVVKQDDEEIMQIAIAFALSFGVEANPSTPQKSMAADVTEQEENNLADQMAGLSLEDFDEKPSFLSNTSRHLTEEEEEDMITNLRRMSLSIRELQKSEIPQQAQQKKRPNMSTPRRVPHVFNSRMRMTPMSISGKPRRIAVPERADESDDEVMKALDFGEDDQENTMIPYLSSSDEEEDPEVSDSDSDVEVYSDDDYQLTSTVESNISIDDVDERDDDVQFSVPALPENFQKKPRRRRTIKIKRKKRPVPQNSEEHASKEDGPHLLPLSSRSTLYTTFRNIVEATRYSRNLEPGYGRYSDIGADGRTPVKMSRRNKY